MSKATLTTLLVAGALALGAQAASAEDYLLSGAVTSASGEKLGGATVSAKADGSTITTTVFTDENGSYYFPPLAGGKYQVWAQTMGFEASKSEVDLSGKRKQNFTLDTIQDFQHQVRQLPGDVILAALPEATEQDRRMKTLVRNNCTGCHTPSFILQQRFDEEGWNKILDLMKNVNVSGVYIGEQRKPNGVIEMNQKELAVYLAKARGPGESGLNIKQRPRPSGEAARVVFTEVDIPLEASNVNRRPLPDGSNWAEGTRSKFGELLHDSYADLDGNAWFTSNTPNTTTTVGRVDFKTGETKMFKVEGQHGLAANSHGMVRDPDGFIWFNANTGRGSLARVDPKTGKIDVFVPPQGMSPTGGATTLDYDGKGMIWVTTNIGALRFDPAEEKFTEYKSPELKSPAGATGTTYGLAADRDGNGWWEQMTLDIVNKADTQTGTVANLKLPPVKAEMDRLSPEQRAYYQEFAPPDFNTPVPWNQGPRRMGIDKNADVAWVGNSWGETLARIDTHTMALSFVPLPYPGMGPYQIAVDKDHNLWMNIWTSDVILKYEPSSNRWTVFDLPSRGTEARHISLLERDGKLEVYVPEYRVSKEARMTFRSEADLAALKAQAGD